MIMIIVKQTNKQKRCRNVENLSRQMFFSFAPDESRDFPTATNAIVRLRRRVSCG